MRCALVNNMPDGALVATEEQFRGLLEAGAGSRPVEVRRYGLTGIPRGPQMRAYQRREYLPLEQLWDSQPDALIVTGSEPLCDSLTDEAYWDDFVRLLDWAAARPTAVLLSCLSAHAALLALDGLERVALPAKCCGVFAHESAPGTALTAGMDRPALMPHSRYNDIPTAAVAGAGWEVLMTSPVGWGAITMQRSQAQLLLVQGHPEYGPATLLREYRRDAGRFLRGERSAPPCLPEGGVAPADREAIERLHCDIVVGGGDAASFDAFPFDDVGDRAAATWRGMAETLYRNWIAGIGVRHAVVGGLRPAPT